MKVGEPKSMMMRMLSAMPEAWQMKAQVRLSMSC